ncbi:MAG: aminotransferase class V-fold PLP-dependent enzyme [Bacteroidales bacterium]|nr:aminotransferase class V-fold PLP-dependent enzyme [Bacteroidales bacterium]MCF8386545.1 aminotransferase class V-fold PLP-dependent enzyme [Bacteroidales bacterium]MCF8398608.1 aminotransferase class V-fold PLP-dependent enzyme [Bacteroidales bacterium]
MIFAKNALPLESAITNLDIAATAVPCDEIMKEHDYWSRQIEKSSPYHVWNQNIKNAELANFRTASQLNVTSEEIALSRNTTEAIDTILRGIEFQKGDEIIYCIYDYPFVQNTIRQLEKRYGINPVPVYININADPDQTIINAYKKAFSPKTKLLCLTHILNWNGRKLPVEEIIAIAKRNNTKVLLDGAQSFAHIPFLLDDLDPDYFAACYHKWFRGPLGTGFIHIKKDNVEKIWPLHGENQKRSGNIENFQHLSTLDFPAFLSINKGFEWISQHSIAAELSRKKSLNQKIYDAFRNVNGISPMIPGRNYVRNGILSYSLLSEDPGKFVNRMYEEHKIILKPIRYRTLNGFRISISDDIGEKDVELLIDAVKKEL